MGVRWMVEPRDGEPNSRSQSGIDFGKSPLDEEDGASDVQTEDSGVSNPHVFTHLFYGARGVARFQVCQTSPDTLRILVETADEPDPEELERIRRTSAEHFGARDLNDVTLEIVDAISPSPSGKHRFVLPYEG